MHQHGTIYRFLQNSAKYSSVNLKKDHFHNHIFFDQMKIASKLEWSPEIRMAFSYPNVKKIIFDKVSYYDMNKPPFELHEMDKKHIFTKFKMLYSHQRFIPETPFLGFLQTNQHHKDWFIWSYTPIQIINSKNEFMEGLYRHGYHANPLLQKIVVDPMCEWDYQKSII
jgi:hypothetical protein